MADNGHQLMILAPGGAGYIFAADTLTAITDSDFRASGDPMYVAYVDGYFVCTTNQSSNFIVSELNDGLSWNALDVGTAESSPDAAIAPVVCKNQLFIVGSLTCEQFSNVGGPGFPFRRSGLFMDKGTQSAFSIASYSDTFMFIGGGENESPAVWALDGNTMVKRSTTAIDTLLQKLTEQELAGVFSWSYAQEGHYFVGFGLPDTTIVYDLTTNRWHERSSRSLVGSDYTDTHYRVGEFVRLGTNLLAADISGGRIGITDTDVYTEFGEATARTFTLQPLQNNMQPFFVPKLELTVESGVGLPDAPDPSVRLQISRDGGKTWGDERSRPMGKMGEYNRRAVWRRNGRSSRFDVYRFTMTDPVKTTVIQLTAQIEGVDDGAA